MSHAGGAERTPAPSPSGAAAAAVASPASAHGWMPLGAPPEELRLDVTLPTGQSFRCGRGAPALRRCRRRGVARNRLRRLRPLSPRRWRRAGPGQYSGVVAGRVFALRQTEEDVLYRLLPLRPAPHHASAAAAPPAPQAPEPPGDAAAALREYFAMGVALAPLHAHFCAVDPLRFAQLAPFVKGARVLRQEPDECLFAFICSSNNHVSRIEGMVQRLCAAYGTCLGVNAEEADDAAAVPYYAFPTAEQLAAAKEEELRALGFGYRAKVRRCSQH